MEPVTGLDKISKQRWKLVGSVFVLLDDLSLFFVAEMLYMRCARGRMHPVHQIVLFLGISRYMRTEGEATHADEVFSGV